MSHIGILPSEPDSDAVSLKKWRTKQAYARQLEAQAAEQRAAKAAEKQQRLADKDIPSGVSTAATGRMPLEAVKSRLEELGAQSRALAEGLSRQRGGGSGDFSGGGGGGGFGRVRELGPSDTIISSPSPSPPPAGEPMNARERARQIASGISALMLPPPPSSVSSFDRDRERDRERERDPYDRRGGSAADSGRYSDHHRRPSDDLPSRRPLPEDYAPPPPPPARRNGGLAPDYRELDRRERERAEGGQAAAPEERRFDGGLERTLVRPAAPPRDYDRDRDLDYPPQRQARSDLDPRDRDRDRERDDDRERDRYRREPQRDRERDYDDRAPRYDDRRRSDDNYPRDNYRPRNVSPPPQQQPPQSYSRPPAPAAAVTSPHSAAASAGPVSFARPAHSNWTSPSGVFESASASAARAAAQAQQQRAYADALRAQVQEKEALRAAEAAQKLARQEEEKAEMEQQARAAAAAAARPPPPPQQPAQEAERRNPRDRERDDRERERERGDARDGPRSSRAVDVDRSQQQRRASQYDDRDRRDDSRSPPRRADRRDRDDRDDRRRADSPSDRSSPRRASGGGRSARRSQPDYDDEEYDERDQPRSRAPPPRGGGGRRDSPPRADSRERERERDSYRENRERERSSADRRRTGGGGGGDMLAAAYADADRDVVPPIVPLLRGLNERSHLGSNLVASSGTDEGADARARVVARELQHDLPAQQSAAVQRTKARLARAREEEAAEEIRVRKEQADLAVRAEKEREREKGGRPSPQPLEDFPPGRSATKAAAPTRRDYEPSRYDDEQAEDERSARSRNGGGSSYRDRERDREFDNAASYNYRSSSSVSRPLGSHRPNAAGLTESTVGLLHLAADAQQRIDATAAALDARTAAARNRHHVQDESEEIGQGARWRGGVGASSHAQALACDRGYANGPPRLAYGGGALAGPEASLSPHARGGSVYESAMRTPPRSPGGSLTAGGGGGYRSQYQSQQPVRASTRNPMEQSLRGSSDFQRVDESTLFRRTGALNSPSRSSFTVHEAPLADAGEFIDADDDDGGEPLLLGSPSASPGRRGVPQLKTKSQFVYPSGKISSELRPATAMVDTRSGRGGSGSGFGGSSAIAEEPETAPADVVERALQMHSPSAASAAGLTSPSRAQAQASSRPMSAAVSQAQLFSTTFGGGGGSSSRPGSSAGLRSPSAAATAGAASAAVPAPAASSFGTPPHPSSGVGSSSRLLSIPSYGGPGVASSYHGSMHRILTPSGSFNGDGGGDLGGDLGDEAYGVGSGGAGDGSDGLMMSPSALRRAGAAAGVNSSLHLAAPTAVSDLYAAESFLDESVQLDSPSPKRAAAQPSPRTRVQPQVTLKPRSADD